MDAVAVTPLVDHHLDEGTQDTSGHASQASAGDPHVWLAPSRYAAVARTVGAELAKADPAHAADYQKYIDDLVGKLTTLDNDFQDGLRNTKIKTFVTSHAAFGYLADHYGLTQIAINGVDPEAEPTPARLADIQKAAKDNGVTTIFFETLINPKLAETVAKDLNLKTAVLDPIEGVKDPSKDDYFSVMKQNLTNPRAALGTAA